MGTSAGRSRSDRASIGIEERHDGLVIEVPRPPGPGVPPELALIPLTWLALGVIVSPDLDAQTLRKVLSVVAVALVGLFAAARTLERDRPRDRVEVLPHQGVTVRQQRRRSSVPAWQIGRVERRSDRIVVHGQGEVLEVGLGLPPALLDRLVSSIEDVRSKASPPPTIPPGLQQLRGGRGGQGA